MRLTFRHICTPGRSFVCASYYSSSRGAAASQPLPDRPGGLRLAALTKPRISPLPEAQWTDEHKQRIAKFLPRHPPGQLSGRFLNVPDLVDRTMTLYNYVTQASLPPRIRELLILRTAWLHGSDVIWRERVPARAGLTSDEIRRSRRVRTPPVGTRSRPTCSRWPTSCFEIRS